VSADADVICGASLDRRQRQIPDCRVFIARQRCCGNAQHCSVTDRRVVVAARNILSGVIAVASIVVAAARDEAVKRVNAFAFVVGVGMSRERGEGEEEK
jgi:hypothetical protein